VVRGGKIPLPLGLGLMAAGTLALLVGATLGWLWLGVLAMVVLGLGQGIAFRTAFGLCVDAVSPASHAQTVSSIYLVTYLGSALPVILLGWAAGRFGQLPSIMVFCIAGAAAALLMLVWSVLSLRRTGGPRAEWRGHERFGPTCTDRAAQWAAAARSLLPRCGWAW